MRKQISVQCGKCAREWLKRADSVEKWGGFCRSCAMQDRNIKLFQQRLCTIPNCGEIYSASGYCNKHYLRWNKFGSPYQCKVRRLSLKRPGELTEHLLANHDVDEKGCWHWKGCHGDTDKYGQQTVDGKSFRVTRLIAHLFLEMELYSPLVVCHACDTPSCCNPKHLFLGTNKDNTDDMFFKKRANKARGEKAGRAKLSEEQVREILKALEGGISQREISLRVGISQSAISLIKRRKNWSHVM